MFRRKSVPRGFTKEMAGEILNAAPPPPPPPPVTKPEPVPVPSAEADIKKVETKPKPTSPTGPTSIIPPETKRVLVVGKFVVMTADVESCDAVIVQGNLDGNIKAKYIVIKKGGCMRGKIECEEADVSGAFEGVELIAHHRLTLSSTARVGGRTTYHKLSVQDGAVLTGELVYKPAIREKEKKPTEKKSDRKSSEKRAAEKKAIAERRAAEREAAERADAERDAENALKAQQTNGDAHPQLEPETHTPRKLPESENEHSASTSPDTAPVIPPEEGLPVER